MDRALSNKKNIILFLLPAVIIFLSVMVVPIIATGYYSLLKWDGIGASEFVGLDNYVKVFLKNGHNFWQSFGHSMIVLLFSLFLQEPIALILALILAKGIKGESFFRTVFFIPMVVSTVVIAQLFMKIYNPDYGLLNTFLRSIGLESATHSWLAEKGTALLAVVIPLVWQFIGYHMLLFYGAIKSISPDIIEAAKIDGASYFKISFKIILPLIMPMVETCIVIATVGSMMTFDFVYVMTNGGPLGATSVPSTIMYDLLMRKYNYGEGSAVAIFIVVECLILTVVLQKVFKKLRKV